MYEKNFRDLVYKGFVSEASSKLMNFQNEIPTNFNATYRIPPTTGSQTPYGLQFPHLVNNTDNNSTPVVNRIQTKVSSRRNLNESFLNNSRTGLSLNRNRKL